MDCQFMTIERVLMSFYIVPDYQREYVWKEDQVITLLEDIKSNALEVEAEDEDPYFIGSIVVYSDHNRLAGKFMLIDGQQRLTTIFLLLCAIKTRLNELGAHINDPLHSSLKHAKQELDGSVTNTFRIELNYPNNQKLLETAYEEGLSETILSNPSTSQRNILKAFLLISEYLKDEFSSVEELNKLVARIQLKVGLVRIETDDLQKAMIVFETLNERGVGLDAFDLLKNLLYRSTINDTTMAQLSSEWETLKNNLDQKGIKPLRFLRYFIVSIDETLDGRPPREKKAFNWFQQKANRTNYEIDRQPVEFAKRLAIASAYYKQILTDNMNPNGERSAALTSLNALAGTSARQQMGILLVAANAKCSSSVFERIVECLESALFYAFSTKLRSQSLEAHIANWTAELQRNPILDEAAAEAFVIRVRGDMKDTAQLFYDQFDTFGQNVVSQKYRQRYILAKYLQYSEVNNSDSDYIFLDEILDQSLDIEHIHPQKPSAKARAEFGEEDEEDIIRCTGLLSNLLLMEQGLQKSGSNGPYSEKRSKFANSKFWLVKKFANPKPEATIKLKESLSEWPTHEKWNRAELERRQMAYAEIARKIWNFGFET